MSKEAQLKQNNQAIAAGMQEAKEKANAAMNAATSQMAIGIISGGLTMAGAAAQLKGMASQAKSELAHLNDPAIESRYIRFTSLVTDLQKASAPAEKQSNQVQKEINRQEQATNKQQADSSETTAEDRKKAAADNIQKFLDILRSMNPQI